MSFKYHKDTDNIVTLTIDMPGRPANVLNDEFGAGLARALDRLAGEENLAGVILTSAKKTFLAGADLDSLMQADDPAQRFSQVERLKAAFRRLETLGAPVIAALSGSALGGGLELALACHHRVALNQDAIKFGFPEVTLGLMPGGGGVVRLTRLLGLQASLPYLMEGKQVSPRQAKAAGIIDDLAADEAEMMTKARAWILSNPKARALWDQPGYRMPGGDSRQPQVAQMLAIAPAMLKKKTLGNYPAPEAILSAAVEGAVVDFETAGRIESRYFVNVATGQTARNMITAFWFQLNQVKAGHSRPKEIEPVDTKKVGVLGAGMMGHGIAYVTAMAGISVVLKDVSLAKAKAGKVKIETLAQQRVTGGRMTVEEKEALLERIHPTGSAADLAGCDLVVEAVFEDRALKFQVTQEAEVRLSPDSIFASNTSTLPITGLAKASARPEAFIGLHFFSPVERMRLVEIIPGQQTSPRTVAKAFDFALKLGKIPIVVNDGRGFYTSRVFATYTLEGLALLAEGQHPRSIEAAGLQAGMPLGPLAALDEVSLSLAWRIVEQGRKDFEAEDKSPPTHPGEAVLDFMVNQVKRPGKAHGAGFYDYPAAGEKHLWPDLQTHFPPQDRQLSQNDMIERLMFVQALETARCLEEGILNSVADANIGSIFGWGFAPFKGGALQYIDDYGQAAFVDRSRELAARYGERFTPPASLLNDE
jgi:3-hydroxyacyl-CoA dehydrogenase/enoyl-CoA hydratase/3-hydroxybutyryl-CoA epimerase